MKFEKISIFEEPGFACEIWVFFKNLLLCRVSVLLVYAYINIKYHNLPFLFLPFVVVKSPFLSH